RQLTTEEGMWGNGKRRQALAEPPLGCREPGQLVLKAPALRGNVLPGRPRRAKSSKTPAISTASGNTLPLSAETRFCGERKRASHIRRLRYKDQGILRGVQNIHPPRRQRIRRLMKTRSWRT